MADGEAVRSLGVAGRNDARVFEWHERPAAGSELEVETLFSGLSAGTELTLLKGSNPYLHASWDAERGVFRAGEPAQTYPVKSMGYMEVGRVSASRRPGVEPGQTVAMAYGHKSRHSAGDGQLAVVLPDELDPLLGIYVAQMGPICANGLLHAAAEVTGRGVETLGDGVRDAKVVVTGAGVVGILTALFAQRHGAAAVAIADRSRRRLAAAAALGLEAIDLAQEDAADWCKRRWRRGPSDHGADIAFQCRGRYEDLHDALRSLRAQATAIDLAFYTGQASGLRLGEEFHHNGLTIRCAQIGRVPRGLADDWDRERLVSETLELLRERGGDVLRHLITDVVPLDDGPALLRDLAARRREAIQAVFSFPGAGPASG